MFCLLFAKGYLSFGCNISTKTEAVALRIKTDKPDELSRTDNTTSMVSVVAQESSYLENMTYGWKNWNVRKRKDGLQ